MNIWRYVILLLLLHMQYILQVFNKLYTMSYLNDWCVIASLIEIFWCIENCLTSHQNSISGTAANVSSETREKPGSTKVSATKKRPSQAELLAGAVKRKRYFTLVVIVKSYFLRNMCRCLHFNGRFLGEPGLASLFQLFSFICLVKNPGNKWCRFFPWLDVLLSLIYHSSVKSVVGYPSVRPVSHWKLAASAANSPAA